MSRGELSYLCQGKVLSFGNEDTLKIIPSLNLHLMDAVSEDCLKSANVSRCVC